METQLAAEWVTFFGKMCATPARNQKSTLLPAPCPKPGRASGSLFTFIRTIFQVNLLLGKNLINKQDEPHRSLGRGRKEEEEEEKKQTLNLRPLRGSGCLPHAVVVVVLLLLLLLALLLLSMLNTYILTLAHTLTLMQVYAYLHTHTHTGTRARTLILTLTLALKLTLMQIQTHESVDLFVR